MLGLSRESLLILAILGGIGIGLWALAKQHPRVAIGAWIGTVAFVPVWLGASFIVYFPPATAAGLLVVAALLGNAPRRWNLADILVIFFFIACLAPVLTGGATISTIFGALFIWLLGYLIGRFAPSSVPIDWIYTCIAIVFSLVALGALVEFAADWHPFESWGPSNGLYRQWGPIQERSAISRSEGAFGHSIALGSSLAMAIPLALASPLRSAHRIVITALLFGGVAVTLSRVALVSAGLAVILSITLIRSEALSRVRAGVAAIIGVAALAIVPSVIAVLEQAGEEAANSAFYRFSLAELIPDLNLIGISTGAYRSTTGELYFSGFQSIDSQLLFTGLTYGAMAVAFAIVLLALAVGATLAGRATPATIAVVAQIPALATVALITQYATFFWFVAGLAVASHTAKNSMTTARNISSSGIPGMTGRPELPSLQPDARPVPKRRAHQVDRVSTSTG